MRIAISKTALAILLAAVGITTIVVLVLESLRTPIAAEVRVRSEQITFDFVNPDTTAQSVTLLNTGLWITHARVARFGKISFKASPAMEETKLARLGDAGFITISPVSPASYVELISDQGTFSLSDILVNGVVRIAWRFMGGVDYNVVLQSIGTRNDQEIMINFSVGDSLTLSLFNCIFQDRNGKMLLQTKSNKAETITFPVSFARQQATVFAHSQALDIDVEIQSAAFVESLDLMKDLRVMGVDYDKKEYSPNGTAKYLSSVLSGSIRRDSYGREDSVKLGEGELIVPAPAGGWLKSLKADSNSINSVIEYTASSIKIGQASAERELVKSEFEKLRENKTLMAIYTISLMLAGLLSKIMIEKRTASLKRRRR